MASSTANPFGNSTIRHGTGKRVIMDPSSAFIPHPRASVEADNSPLVVGYGGKCGLTMGGRRVANGFLCDVVPGTITRVRRGTRHPSQPSSGVRPLRRRVAGVTRTSPPRGDARALRRQPRWSRGLGMEVRIGRLTWAAGVTLFAGWRGWLRLV